MGTALAKGGVRKQMQVPHFACAAPGVRAGVVLGEWWDGRSCRGVGLRGPHVNGEH